MLLIKTITLIFIGALNKVSAGFCSIQAPLYFKDCFTYSTIDKSCCFLRENNGTRTACYEFDPRSSSMSNNIVVNGIDYIAYCDLDAYIPQFDTMLKCGIDGTPYYNCGYYSRSDNTCCSYSFGSTQGCFYFGRVYSGEMHNNLIKFSGLEIYCETNYFNFFHRIFIFILFFIF
jgi:hypothetical protein